MSPRSHPLARLIIAAFGIVVAAVIVTFVIGAALQTAALASGRNATSIEAFLNNNALLVTTLFYPPALLVLWVCRRTLDRLSFRSLGLRARGSLSGFASGAVAAFYSPCCGFVAWCESTAFPVSTRKRANAHS
jgi:ABC-type amino acid transport system permease subunit